MSTSSSGLRSRLWFVPVMCVLAGVLVSVVTLAIDRAFGFDLIPRWLTGGPDAAMGILTTIAASMVSLATLVLTITMVVVQLAMGQFSPRIVQTFLRDTPSQLAIGLFVATFAHAMIAMREVGFEGGGQVPGVAIAVGYVLVLTSIAMLVIYVDHIGRSLRVSALIELVGEDTRRLLDETYAALPGLADPPPEEIVAPRSGVLVEVDHDRLVAIAMQADCVLHLRVPLGTFVPAGAPLIDVEGAPDRLDREAALAAVRSALERTMDQDVAYGFRMLVDMAERSLSESPYLDPTTAVQCVDRLHDGLRQLATKEIPNGEYHDDAGNLRLTIPSMDWDDFVHLAFDEIRMAGSGATQVSRRLLAALDDLLTIVTPPRRTVLEQQRELLVSGVRRSHDDDVDTTRALVPDPTGLGVVDGDLASPPGSGRGQRRRSAPARRN